MQGVCADCWGSKGGRQFWIRKHGPRTSAVEDWFGIDPIYPLIAIGVVTPLIVGALLWILG